MDLILTVLMLAVIVFALYAFWIWTANLLRRRR